PGTDILHGAEPATPAVVVPQLLPTPRGASPQAVINTRYVPRALENRGGVGHGAPRDIGLGQSLEARHQSLVGLRHRLPDEGDRVHRPVNSWAPRGLLRRPLHPQVVRF